MPLNRTVLAAASGFLLTGSMVVAALAMTGTFGSASADNPAQGAAARRVVIENGPAGPERVIDRDSISEAQSDALADGYVTREEYETAIRAAFACIRDAGQAPKREPYWDASGLRLQYEFWADDEDSGTWLECQAAHSMLVDVTWSIQTVPSEAQAEAAWTALQRCLLDGGAPPEVAAASSHADLAEASARAGLGALFSRCGRSVAAEFGIPGWGF